MVERAAAAAPLGYQVLLGRDVLSHCVLVYDGPSGCHMLGLLRTRPAQECHTAFDSGFIWAAAETTTGYLAHFL